MLTSQSVVMVVRVELVMVGEVIAVLMVAGVVVMVVRVEVTGVVVQLQLDITQP